MSPGRSAAGSGRGSVIAMPYRRIPAPPDVAAVLELLEPFGYVHSWGDFALEMILAYDPAQPPETAAAARAYALGQAGKVIAALEGGGYEIFECSVTIRGVPVEATMRLEIGAQR